MVEKWDPESIKRLLNISIVELDQSTLERLRDARRLAISRHEALGTTMSLFIQADGQAIWHSPAHRHSIGYRTGTILIAACIFGGIFYWQQTIDSDNNDVDIAILTDDLPIQYFLD